MGKSKPAAATVFGILNIVFGALGLVGSIVGVTTFAAGDPLDNPVLRVARENELYASWCYATTALGFFVGVLLVAAGIGLLNMRPWARKISIGYCIYAIVTTAIGGILNFTVVIPALWGVGPIEWVRVSMAAGTCLAFVYPVVLLMFMLRPSFKEAFRQ